MCSWPLDSPLHCRICASHPDIALDRASRGRSTASAAATRQQQRRSVIRSKSCEADAAETVFVCDDMAAHTASEKVAACPVKDNSSSDSSAENARFGNQYKSRKTKSYAFLLIFFCAVLVRTSYAVSVTRGSGQRLILHTSQYRQRYHQNLLLEQRAKVQPTPHHHHLHHRSVSDSSMSETNPNEESYSDTDCQLVVRALKKAQKQANTTFEVIREYLAEFTRSQFNQEPSEMRAMWQMHKLHLQHPYAEHLVRDFDVMPDSEHFQRLLVQPISRQTLQTELQKVYITLKTLDNAFDEVIRDRREREDVILHDLNNTVGNLKIINKFFEEAHRHVSYDLQETKDAMDKLNIPIPDVEADVQYDRNNHSIRDYLLANEHLSIMQYLRGLYTFLLSQCPAASATQ